MASCNQPRYLRLRGDRIIPEYGSCDGKFTLEIHHSGKFYESLNGLSYEGDIVDNFDCCEVDEMSLIELIDMYEVLGFKEKMDTYYKMSGSDWVKIETDSQFFSIVNTEYCKLNLVVPVYIEETSKPTYNCPLTKPKSQPKSNPKSKPKSKKKNKKKSSEVHLLDEPIQVPFGFTDDLPNYPANDMSSQVPPAEPLPAQEPLPAPEVEFEPEVETEAEVETGPELVTEPELETGALPNQPKEVPVLGSIYVPYKAAYPNSKQKGNCKDKGKGKVGESKEPEIDDDTDEVDFNESDYEYDKDDTMFVENLPSNVDIAGDDDVIEQIANVEDDVEVQYDQSDYEVSGSDSEGGAGRVKRKKWPEFNKNTDMNNVKFKLGMLFPSMEVLAEAIKEYAIKNCKEIKFVKKEKKKLRAVCKKPCRWVLHASMLPTENTVQVKTLYDEHTCPRTYDNIFVTSQYLARYYQKQIRSNPKWPIQSFFEQVKIDLKVEVSICKLYRAKAIALNMIHGSLGDQYASLHDYVEELKSSNPGSTVVMLGDKTDCSRFGRIYVCFGALKKGYRENCRPLIGLDGCHLYGPTGGVLLAAVGVDGNNNLYPVAYAVVESENKSSWQWFLELLKDDLGIVNTFGWTFMTDKQKGLLPVIEELCENSEHRTCLRHLYNNMKIKYKGLALKDAMYDAARSTTVPEIESPMNPGPQKLPKKFQNSSLRCGNCNQAGHNKRSCKEAPKSNPQPQLKKTKRSDGEAGSTRLKSVNITKKKLPVKRAKNNKFPSFMENIDSQMTFEHNQPQIQPVQTESVSSVGYGATVMQTQASQTSTNAGREQTGGQFVTLLSNFIGGGHVLFSTKPSGGPSTQ